ncbi:MAG: hypothetical protein SVM80_04950 [Halobacteriota archaeon]|nr:hypothetical protein [Halobacteriota archaeon]
MRKIVIIGAILLLFSIFLLSVIDTVHTSDLSLGPDKSITILNPQSYPVVGGDWVIYFNTTGHGTLEINDHSFPEEVGFVGLYQKEGAFWVPVKAKIYDDLISSNWSYLEGKAVFGVKTSGEHILQFRFGDDIKYAHNYAIDESAGLWNDTFDDETGIAIKEDLTVSGGDVELEEIEFYYTESESQSTWNTDTSWQDKATLTFTPDGGNYLILASAELRGTNDGYDIRSQLTVDGTTYGYLTTEPDEEGSSLWSYHFSTHRIMNLDSSEHTIKIQYSTENTGGTVGIKNARIAVLEMKDYHFAETDTEQSLSTSYSDIVTETFNVDTPGYYLIIGSSEYRPASTSYSVYAQLWVDSTSLGEAFVEGEQTTDYRDYISLNVSYLSAGSHTLKIQGRSESGTMYMRRARVSAIRLTDHYNHDSISGESYTTNGGTSWADKTVLSFTPPVAADYLIFGTGLVGVDAGNSANQNGFWDMTIDQTEYGYMQRGASDNSDRAAYFSFKNLSLDAQNHDVALRYRSGSSASPDAGMGNARIIAIPVKPYETSGNLTSIEITPQNFTSWDRFYADDATPSGTSITYKILDENNNTIMSVTSGQDISSITNTTIRLLASLSTTNVSLTPTLHDWNVTWITPLGVNWWNQSQSSDDVNRGDSIVLRARWTDPTALLNATLQRNVSGAWQNVSTIELNGTEDWSNFTLSSELLSWDIGNISWRIYANSTTGNFNYTDTMSFDLWGLSNLSWVSPADGSNYTQGTQIPLKCLIRDANNSSSINNHPVNFYWWNATTSNTTIGSNSTNNTGHATINWDTTGLSAGTYYIKSNITDNETLYYNVTSEDEANISIIIISDSEPPKFYTPGLSVSEVAQGDTTELWISITDNSGVNSSKFKIMYPNGTEYNFTASLKNKTTQSGFWNYTFNTTGKPLGTYNWTFAYADDGVNEWNSTTIELKFNVSDMSPPIMGIPGYTDMLELGNEQNITISIIDASNLTVNISIEDLDGGANKTMNGTTPSFWYAYTPPASNETVNFTVYAVDSEGYQSSTSGNFSVGIFRIIEVNSGYTLISLPLNEWYLYAENFGSSIPNITKVTMVNRTTKTYSTRLISITGDNYIMEPGYGYWTYGSSNETSQRFGAPVDTIISDLITGWNLIGLKANATASETATDIGSNCTQIVGNWNKTVYENTYIVGVGGDFNMTIGKGYWVWVDNDTTWIY